MPKLIINFFDKDDATHHANQALEIVAKQIQEGYQSGIIDLFNDRISWRWEERE